MFLNAHGSNNWIIVKSCEALYFIADPLFQCSSVSTGQLRLRSLGSDPRSTRRSTGIISFMGEVSTIISWWFSGPKWWNPWNQSFRSASQIQKRGATLPAKKIEAGRGVVDEDYLATKHNGKLQGSVPTSNRFISGWPHNIGKNLFGMKKNAWWRGPRPVQIVQQKRNKTSLLHSRSTGRMQLLSGCISDAWFFSAVTVFSCSWFASGQPNPSWQDLAREEWTTDAHFWFGQIPAHIISDTFASWNHACIKIRNRSKFENIYNGFI